MVKPLKVLKLWILGALLSIFIIGFPFAIYGISYACGNTLFPYYAVHLVLIAIDAFLSYLSGDIVIYKYKKSTGEINPAIPENITDKANKYRTPFIISLIFSLLFIAVFFIIYLATGHWPLL